MALLLLLLLLSLRASCAQNVRNCSSVLQFSDPSALYIGWHIPPAQRHPSCLITIKLAYSVVLQVSYYSGSGVIYNPTAQCYSRQAAVSQDWSCEPGCQGLFYSKQLYGPQLVQSMQDPLQVRTSLLRMLYCHPAPNSGHFTDVELSIHSNERSSNSYQDPVWRVLGPVLATVCMVATVFLVCVCYVQHAYQRGQPRCCRWINARLRGPQPPEAASRSGQVDAGQLASAHRHIEPGIDLPPAYDDFRKYHRPCSFGEADRPRHAAPPPPSYSEAVHSLEQQQEVQQRALCRSVRRSLSCGADGVDNPAFQREEPRSAVSAEDLSLEMDLGEGQTAPPSASNC